MNDQGVDGLHPIRFSYEHVNDQFLFGRFPFLRLRNRVYVKPDIVVDVLDLSTLVI